MTGEWIPLEKAAETLAAAMFKNEGVTPTTRRAYAARHIADSRKMIESLWRTGTLSLRAGSIETRSGIAADVDLDPRTLEDAFFFEPEVLSGSRLGEAGWEDIKASDISVSRPDFDEWLKYNDLGPRIPKAGKSPPSVDRLANFLADVADGTQTEPELKRIAEEHFGCNLPEKARWRPAWSQIDESKKRPRGGRTFKSGN
ncbi:MAG: hypothetical protein E5X33_12025 [Mesorhizobium sp.]|uniref:hypothetical protein n=1 Tax=Mesorhizobium sp. TaxID=1871066 RepID=UPI00121F1BAB|nr:hypothetical protein [Mesorhizobium sp.]TIR21786.1 MAG: hypothetical protein E5X33_12025 [Mesorhizobium sp.]